jgi:WD40 repeat protein
MVYDPRTGINVSDFVRTDDERFHPKGGPFGLKSLQYITETSEVIGISSRKSLVVWRYNSAAPITVLPGHGDIVECLSFNPKEPILIFSGGDDGIIRKWERLQLNMFMYR